MRVLFISTDLIAGNIAYLLKKEGHEVKIYIAEKARRSNFSGLLEQTEHWQDEVAWVGKDGLIVFDDTGYGHAQDKLRREGYSVFGGSALGDRLESDREYAQEIFKTYGMQTVTTKNFSSVSNALAYAKKHPRAWVIKQNGHASKSINYVSIFDDGRDAINQLENYLKNNADECETITLQERVVGCELAVARYFNGNDWVGPIEVNIEHKKFFPGDLGPTTSEMGTLAWYTTNEKNKIFQETLGKLKPHLQEINFRGILDINCIVNEKGAFPLEATPRFGSPINQLQSEFNITPWGALLKAVADGKSYERKVKTGYGIVVLLAVPPFPYTKKLKGSSSEGLKIFFKKKLKQADWEHIHFEEVSTTQPDSMEHLYVSDYRGYVMYVTGTGTTVEKAREEAYGLINHIVIPKMFYRPDIGVSFINRSKKLLRSWGYL